MDYIKNIREKKPLIHNITNYVTVNDVANCLLGIGASPVMADAPEEMADMAGIASALNINIGTLNQETVLAMHAAGKAAAALHKPVVLDPVGAGASAFRTETALFLMREIPFTVIKGNISEIKALFSGAMSTSGVDASEEDLLTKENEDDTVEYLRTVAGERTCILVVTGVRDIVTDGKTVYLIDNGCPEMKEVTGTGCMLSALLAAFISANPKTPLEAAASAVMTMGIAGERAQKQMQAGEGNFSYRGRILDAISQMTDEDLRKAGRYDVR